MTPLRWMLLLLFCLLSLVVSLGVGTHAIDPGTTWAALTGGDVEPHIATIVREVRLPRALTAFGVGLCLSIAGVVFQALLRNDLAEPYLIGVGPGALLGVTIAAVIAGSGVPNAALRGIFAFAGAIAAGGLVFAFARQARRQVASAVVLAGVALGALITATATVVLHAAVRDWHRIWRWLLGDLSLAAFPDAALVGGCGLVGLLILLWRARDLDLLCLGERAAFHAGLSVRRSLWMLGGLGCLLAALSVSAAGLVGFVGLAVPHVARGLVGARHRLLVPTAALLGGGLLVLADVLARTAHAPQGLPLGTVTAALGAPVLVFLLMSGRAGREG